MSFLSRKTAWFHSLDAPLYDRGCREFPKSTKGLVEAGLCPRVARESGKAKTIKITITLKTTWMKDLPF
jgi:hypothetical protein